MDQSLRFLFLKSKESALWVAPNGKVFSLKKKKKNLCDTFRRVRLGTANVEGDGKEATRFISYYSIRFATSTFYYSNWLLGLFHVVCVFLFSRKVTLCRIRVALHGNLFFFPGSSSFPISLSLSPFCYSHSLHSCRPIDNQHRRRAAERDARWATQLGRDPKANVVGAPPLLSLFNISNCLSK